MAHFETESESLKMPLHLNDLNVPDLRAHVRDMQNFPLNLAPTEKRIARNRVIQQKLKLLNETAENLEAAIDARCELKVVVVSMSAYLGSLTEVLRAISGDVDPAGPG